MNRGSILRSARCALAREQKLLADVLPDEEWRDVPSVPGMKASSLGRVRYRDGKARLGSWQRWSGQGRYIMLIKKPITQNFMISRLVCEAFHGPSPIGKPNALHDDEDARNNKAGNLKWGTQKENLNYPGFIDYCHGRVGANSPYAKSQKRKQKDASLRV